MLLVLVPGMLLLGGVGAPAAEPGGDARPGGPGIEPRDDLVLGGAVRVAAGTWRVVDAGEDGALRITQDGTVLDLTGVELDGRADPSVPPEAQAGIGIHIVGARDVVIRGGRLRGYRIAVRAEEAPGLRLVGVDADEGRRQRLASTPEREAAEDWLWPHENDGGEWETRYGAAFSLLRCAFATIEGCRARHGQNGVLLSGCRRVRIIGNDLSWQSGWGVALWRSCENVIAWNTLDHCVRGMSPGVYHRGQDSAAVLVFEQSHGNVVTRNHATHSGDGFFLYAGHETTQRTGVGGCERNIVTDNDFRFAVANGIEATFSAGNVFAGNDVGGCDHGVWAGYSRDTLIVEQRAQDCLSAGISIEHGVGNRIVGNEIVGGRRGIHLWWDDDPAFLTGPYGAAQDTRSAENVIEGNTIRGSEVALELDGDVDSLVRWNQLGGASTGLRVVGAARPAELAFNLFVGTRRRSGDAPRALDAPPGLQLDARNLRRHRLADAARADVAALHETHVFARPAVRRPAAPDVPAPDPLPPRVEAPEGRDTFRMGPYGPLPPTHEALVPERPTGGATTLVHVFTPGAWRVAAVHGDVVVEPRAGRGDARIAIRAAPGVAPRPVPFDLEIELASGRRRVEGHLLPLTWNVAWFHVDGDPLGDADAFARTLAGAPVATATVDALDFPWRGGAPDGVRADGFATRARTDLSVPAGRYRLAATSDDGVRIRLDGRVVLEDWSRHGPREQAVVLDLAAGRHTLEVEHVELDGWAWLTVDLLPAR
jgi:nitrous oxidase accessory protein NosD